MTGMVARQALKIWRQVVDTVTPPQCLVCRSALTQPSSLCVSCWQKLAFIDAPVCNVLGTPFTYDAGEGAVSAAALADPPPWDRARGAVVYDDASRPLVHALKYHDVQEAGILMARMMARAGRQLLAEADVLVPVPLHRWRLWRRRFNQSAFLGQRLAAGSGQSCLTDVLWRVKATRPQVGLAEEARRRNVSRAFAVHAQKAAAIQGRHVLLVDDVMTTGATAGACAAALKSAGARQVDVLCFALVIQPAKRHI